MAKPLSDKNLEKRKLILKAVEDYFGRKIEEDSFRKIVAALKSGSTKDLTEEERRCAWTVDVNLKDPVYIANLKQGENTVA